MPCTSDHQSGDTCSRKALNEILQSVVPVECLAPLQTLMTTCSSENSHYTLCLNQRRGAIKAFKNSEQRFSSPVTDRAPQEDGRDVISQQRRWQNQQKLFLQSLIDPDANDVLCPTWKQLGDGVGLVRVCGLPEQIVCVSQLSLFTFSHARCSLYRPFHASQ